MNYQRKKKKKSRINRLRFVFDDNWLKRDLSLSAICLERESTRAQCHVAIGPRLVHLRTKVTVWIKTLHKSLSYRKNFVDALHNLRLLQSLKISKDVMIVLVYTYYRKLDYGPDGNIYMREPQDP